MSAAFPHLRLISRASALAQAQTQLVGALLQQHYPQLALQYYTVISEGDQHLESNLAKLGGKGLFTRALEQQLLAEQADLAVHSLKDLPVKLPAGLCLGAVLARGNAADVLISHAGYTIQSLPPAAVVATSSLRRISQLLALRPDLQILPLRGNIDSRMQRLLQQPHWHAIVLAAAGLARLPQALPAQLQAVALPYTEMLPAIAQGALAVECRSHAPQLQQLLAPLHHQPTAYCVQAERQLAHLLGASCHSAVGAYAELIGNTLQLQAIVLSHNGQQAIRAEASAPMQQPEQAITSVAEQVANSLLTQGAAALLTVTPST